MKPRNLYWISYGILQNIEQVELSHKSIKYKRSTENWLSLLIESLWKAMQGWWLWFSLTQLKSKRTFLKTYLLIKRINTSFSKKNTNWLRRSYWFTQKQVWTYISCDMRPWITFLCLWSLVFHIFLLAVKIVYFVYQSIWWFDTLHSTPYRATFTFNFYKK